MRILWSGAQIFDGTTLWSDRVLSVVDGRVEGLFADGDAPSGDRITCAGGVLCPGFIDLQVNGGGGVLLGQGDPVDGLQRLLAAHRTLGATGVMPTLITADPATTRQVLDAAEAVDDAAFLGLHLEGPHLDPIRKGAHDPALIRPMSDADLALYCKAAQRLPRLLITLAPESATPAQIRSLVQAGALVSLGHSDCTLDSARAAFAAGASMVTHLYNAMSPLSHRAPGLVGAALDSAAWVGIIPDGIHVSPEAFRIAVRAAPGRIFAVTDAMAVAGTALTSFTLNGRAIQRRSGQLTLTDGTLAGADIDMAQALRWMVHRAQLPLEDALAMTTRRPAQAMGLSDRGHLMSGARADLVHLSDDLTLEAAWQSGTPVAVN